MSSMKGQSQVKINGYRMKDAHVFALDALVGSVLSSVPRSSLPSGKFSSSKKIKQKKQTKY